MRSKEIMSPISWASRPCRLRRAIALAHHHVPKIRPRCTKKCTSNTCSLWSLNFAHLTSDDILRYVGAFYKGAGSYPLKLKKNKLFNIFYFLSGNLSEFWGHENGCTFVILRFVGPWGWGGGIYPQIYVLDILIFFFNVNLSEFGGPV
jgi:hypothetical protein